jgi:hypothetical protein
MKQPDFRSNRTAPDSSDYACLVCQVAQNNQMTGYHLTVVYKGAQSDTVANSALRAFMKKFFIYTIGNNHRRHIKSIKSFCFLDVPGSRQGWTSQFEITSAQGNLHHHIILLLEGAAEKKMARWFADTGSVEFRRLNQTTPSRNHMLQKLPTLEDIRRCAGYAAKSVRRLDTCFEDAYLLPSDTTLLPKPVMLPIRAYGYW